MIAFFVKTKICRTENIRKLSIETKVNNAHNYANEALVRAPAASKPQTGLSERKENIRIENSRTNKKA